MEPPIPETILCADRDRKLCRMLEKALAGQGYRVVPAHDGHQALRTAREASPALAILELGPPELDGLEVLAALRQPASAQSDTPVLLLSGTPISRAQRERADALGAAAFLTKPISLRALLERVAEHLKTATPVTPACHRNATPDVAEIAGSFRELAFPDLLHHLHGLRASGVLELNSGRKHKAIQLRDGYPVAVSSNLVGECLGNLLQRRGALSAEQMQESIRRVKRGEGLQGQILVAMDLLSEAEVSDALREQAEEKLFEVFEWSDGAFVFRAGRRLSRTNQLALSLAPVNLILEGVRRRLPIERVDAFIQAKGDCFVAHGEIPFYRFQDAEIGPAAETVLAALDARQRVSEFAAQPPEVRRALFGLVVTEVVELRAQPGVGTRPAPRATRPKPEVDAREALATTAQRMRDQSWFEILDVSTSAGPEEIDRAYAALARSHHPDRFKNQSQAVRSMAEAVQAQIARAHETLRDPERNREYRAEWREGRRAAAKELEGRRTLEAEMEFQKGEAKLRQRRYEDALACFGTALQKNSSEGEYHAHYGWCLHLCHPDDVSIIQEAIEHVKRGVKLARDHEKPYLFLGRLYKAIGKAHVAERVFTRAVQIRPDCVEALRELRLINLRRKKSRGLLGRLLRK